MIVHLNLSLHRKTRVWLDEMPDALFPPERTLEQVLQTAAPRIATPRQAAVELLVPKGPQAMYGLLGAEFVPNASGTLHIRVHVGGDKSKRYASPLVLKSEDVSVGLGKELADTVLEVAVIEMNRDLPLPSGDLVFSCAVQGAVGSNRVLFKQLGSCLAKLILLENRQPDPEQLVSIFVE